MKKATTYMLSSAVLILFTSNVNAATINFDEFYAPSLFADQVALSDEYYASLGVTFIGTGEVLNQDSNFIGVSKAEPFSSPNFLAFNSDFGAFPPETILFSSTMNYFDLDFGGFDGTATITAYLGDVEQGAVSADAVFSVWTEMALSGITFDRIVFDVSGTGSYFAVDNLNFTAAVPVPAAIWLFISGLAGLFGIRKLK